MPYMASAQKKRLVVGNWKMYIEDVEDARALVSVLKRKSRNFKNVEVWVAPSSPFIPVTAAMLKQSVICVGAQTLSQFGSAPVSAEASAGKHTGEVSARMLKDVGASFVIVGHSERRALGEDDTAVNAKLKNALGAGLRTILCIGEHARDEHGGHFEFIANQLRSALVDVPKPGFSKLVIAYEPVWAIGKNAADAARPELVRETTIFIRKTLVQIIGRESALRIPILYGGSVEGENAGGLMREAEISGFLVGRASTEAEKFWDIIQACQGIRINHRIECASKESP